MPTATDVAMELGEVVAWLRAWEHSEADVLMQARNDCLAILMETWRFLLGDGKVPARKPPSSGVLAMEVKSIRPVLEQWDNYTEKQRKAQLKVVSDILASAIAFFSA